MRRIVVMTLALTLFGGAIEGTEKFDPSPSAKLLAPFIEPETIAIVRIDFTRLDVEALFAKVQELHDSTKDHDVWGILQAKGAVNRWVAEFVRAGGKHFYFVHSLIDMPSPMYFTVVPVGSPADTKVISALIVSGDPEGPATRPANYRGSHGPFGVTMTRRIGDVILAGRREIQLERLLQNPAVNRPEAAKAFAAAGDATVQILLLPTADTRRVIEEMLPELPEEVGGGPSTVVTRGVMWVAIGVNGPPNMSASLVVQSEDRAAASRFRDLLPKYAKMLIFEPLGYGKALQEKLPNMGELTEMLTPDVVGNRLSLVLDDKQVNRVILEMLVPALREAAARARRARSGHNMRQVASAALKYAMQHDGIWPEGLQTLVKAKQLSAKRLVNPRKPQRETGYVYLRPSVPLRKLPRSGVETVLLYEAYDKWGGGIWVGFADAHVEWVVDEGYFKKLLQEAQSISVKPDRKGGVK